MRLERYFENPYVTLEEWQAADQAHDKWLETLPKGKSFMFYESTVQLDKIPPTGCDLYMGR